jgi:acetyl-CoA carboxylase beta subunit
MANIKQSARKTKSKARSRTVSAADPDGFERARKTLDKKKQTRELKTQWAHFWNLCPKCGGDMFEQSSLKIRYEVCRKCHGIYIDQAEANLVKRFLDPVKWLRAALRRSKDPKTT